MQKRILAGKAVSAADYIEVLRSREKACREMAAFMADYDALLAPTTPITAVALEQVDEEALPFSRLTRAANYLGLCALTVPMGITAAGLPTSLQIIGKPFREDTVLRVGWAYEQANPVLEAHRPPLSPLLDD